MEGDILYVQFLQEPTDTTPTRSEGRLVGDGKDVKRVAVPKAAFRAGVSITGYEVKAKARRKDGGEEKMTYVVYIDVKRGFWHQEFPKDWMT